MESKPDRARMRGDVTLLERMRANSYFGLYSGVRDGSEFAFWPLKGAILDEEEGAELVSCKGIVVDCIGGVLGSWKEGVAVAG